MKNSHRPPKWADHFLHWFCSEELLEEIQGDLHEAYQYRRQAEGKWRADWHFVSDVFSFFQPYAFEKYSEAKQFLPMFDNYFKITLRNIMHRKGFTAINFIGLTIGITAVMLIGFYLKNEWTYDQNTPDSDRIFRLMNNYRDQTYSNMSFTDYFGSDYETQLTLLKHLEQYEEVETATHFVPSQAPIAGGEQYFVEVDNQQFIAENALYTNAGISFQDIFPQAFLMGTAETAFSDFNKIVLTEKLAERWFGENWSEQQLIGTSLTIREEIFDLAGIIENVPDNTHFTFDFIVHQKLIPSWGAYTYFKLAPDINISSVMAQLNAEVDQFYPGYSEDELAKGIEAVALEQIHFTEGNLYELKSTANKTYLTTFGIVGLIILLIIWTNYTNLSVAMYADRQKELGMRKVLGARSQDIIAQVLMEAITLALLCFPICWLLIRWILPHFNELMDIKIPVSLLWHPFTLLTLLGLLFLTGLFSGIYPAFTYGKRSMLRLFGKNLTFNMGNRFFNFRNALVMGQFIMVVTLLSITYFIYQQMEYVQQKDLGFEQEGVIYFPVDGAEKYQQLKTSLRAMPEIEAVGANGVPGVEMANQLTYKMKDTDVTFSDGSMEYIDFGNLEALNIECEACESLEKGKERIFVINKTAAEKLAKIKGIAPEDLIGQTLISEPEYENEEYGFGIPHVIDGIIEDYNYHTLKIASQPMLIEVYSNMPWVYHAVIKANTKNWKATIQQVKTAYEEVEKVRPFDFTFLEDHLNQLYASERRAGVLMASFSLIALILAFMGLAGVVSYIAYSRQKEIGIRKVLGASMSNILVEINREFVLLMGIATVVALPIAILLANRWLESFAYRIVPQFWVVLLAGALALILVLILVTFQSSRAASTSPIEVLKAD